MRKHSLTLLTAALLFSAAPLSQAAEIVNFAWAGSAGYTAAGSFVFDPATTPTSFLEAPGAGPTSYLQSFSVTFYDPSHTVLETGSSIVGGVSSDRFFTLNYNTQTQQISSLDADIGGSSYQYFLTNLRTPDGMVVGPGVTTFNFFYRPNADAALDTAAAVRVTSIAQTPEPALFAPVALVLGILGFVSRQRRHASPR